MAIMRITCCGSMASNCQDRLNVIFVKRPIERRPTFKHICEYIVWKRAHFPVHFARNRIAITPICGSIWKHIHWIDPSFVTYAEMHSNRLTHWDVIFADIREKGHTNVHSVPGHSVRATVWIFIIGHTPANGRSAVIRVKNVSVMHQHCTSTRGFTQMKIHMFAICAVDEPSKPAICVHITNIFIKITISPAVKFDWIHEFSIVTHKLNLTDNCRRRAI